MAITGLGQDALTRSGAGGSMGTMASGMAGNALSPAVEGMLQKTGISGLMSQLGIGRADPDIPYRYFIEIDGIQCVRFKEVSGLKMTTHTTRIREGGNNRFEHTLIDGQTFEPLTIKKGFYGARNDFFTWMYAMHAPKANEHSKRKKTVALVALDDKGIEVCRFNFFNAFITEYAGPEFDATSRDIAFESVKISYDFFELDPASLAARLKGEALSTGMAILSNAL